MNNHDIEKLDKILKDYADLPEYSGMDVPSIGTKGLFGNYPLNTAATRGLSDEVTILLSHGANVNAVGEHGYTPLHDAVEQGHMDVVKLLIKSGADLSAKTADGDTPIELAEKLKESEILHLLRTAKNAGA